MFGQACDLLPIVPQAINGVLCNAHISEEGATVLIPIYPGMAEDDLVSLYWEAKSASNIYTQTVEIGRAVTFSIAKSLIAASYGQRVIVSCFIPRNDGKHLIFANQSLLIK